MPMALINDLYIHYKEEGTGTPLLLLHGLTSNLLMYEKEMTAFKDRFRVIALDSRGHGESDKPSAYTLSDHVQDVLGLMDHLHIEKAHVLGISMGSYIAQGVAIEAPERVDQLVLVSAKAHGKTSSMARLFKEHETEIEGMDYEESLNHLSRYIFHNLVEVGKGMTELRKKSVVLSPVQQKAANVALEGFDFREALDKIQAETLVLSGTYDGLNPPEKGKEIAALIPNATYVEFEESGHSPNVEEKDRFLKTVGEFLRS